MIFDASVIIALITNEPGAEEISNYLSYNIIMSTVNIGEVYKYVYSNYYNDEVQTANFLDLINSLEIQAQDFTLERALISGQIFPKTKQYGLSFGDRACLALAITDQLPVLTCDREWKNVDLGIDIILAR